MEVEEMKLILSLYKRTQNARAHTTPASTGRGSFPDLYTFIIVMINVVRNYKLIKGVYMKINLLKGEIERRVKY